ncbi:hypothetical protein C2W58_02625 [Bacillus pumilus]|nr:hypothetical protein C2W58_02625 [Bacillus pumilus]
MTHLLSNIAKPKTNLYLMNYIGNLSTNKEKNFPQSHDLSIQMKQT